MRIAWDSEKPKKTKTKKKWPLYVLLLLFITCTPLYEWIPPWPETVILRGTMPPNGQLKILVGFQTTSILCRDFSFGSGSFLPSGGRMTKYYTTSDAEGNYEVPVTIERQSPFCNWSNKGFRVYYFPQHVNTIANGEAQRIASILFAKNSKNTFNLICVRSYKYLFHDEKMYHMVCRTAQYTGTEKDIYAFPRLFFDKQKPVVTLNFTVQEGIEYDFKGNYDEAVHDFWKFFDALPQ